jgi:hypothetical protein
MRTRENPDRLGAVAIVGQAPMTVHVGAQDVGQDNGVAGIALGAAW